MRARDVFGVAARAIGLWLLAHGIIVLSSFLIMFAFVSQLAGSAEMHGVALTTIADPVIRIVVGAILLFRAEGLVEKVYGPSTG